METEIEVVASAEQISDDPQPGPSRSSGKLINVNLIKIKTCKMSKN